MRPTKSITIIIPVYNRLQVTQQGLSCMTRSAEHYHNTPGPKYSVNFVVIDDGSTDGTAEWIEANYPQITVLRGDGNLWWTGAVNLGIKHVMDHFEGTEGIILQNDDVVVEEDWVSSLIQTITRHPDSLVGCATSVLNEKDVIQYGGRKLHPWFARETKLNAGMEKSRFPKGYVSPSFDLYGRGLYIPLRVFEKTGLFNQHQFRHRGDMDIPLRAKKAGYKLLVSYDAVVYEFPELTYGLDTKERISLREVAHLLTDFRSSHNFKFIYYYSLNATRNPFQFIVFFTANLFYNMRRVCWRYLHQYI